MSQLLEHNKVVYDEIVEKLNKGCRSLCYVQGTGSGKSTIFRKLVEDYFLSSRILYVAPKLSIIQAIKSYPDFDLIADRVDFITYQSYKRKYSAEAYDVVFVDEAHHLGSNVYGKYILKSKPKYFIGLTATPERSNDRVNVVHLFDEVVYGLSTFECIRRGLMPKLEYYVCNKEALDIAKEQNYKEVINYADSIDLLQAMVRHNTRARWFCFFSNVKELQKSKSLITKLFPDYLIVELHSKAKSKLKTIGKLLETHTKVVVLSVDMLLEGVHLEGFEGIIFFRNVQSTTVFQQILGRVLSISNKGCPVVIDCTKSACRILQRLMLRDGYMKSCVDIDGSKILKLKKEEPKESVLSYVRLSNCQYFEISTLLSMLLAKKFVYKDTVYANLNQCCNVVGAKISKVRDFIIKYKMSPADAIDAYFNEVIKSQFNYFGSTYNSLESACQLYSLDVSEVLDYARENRVSLQVAIDLLRTTKGYGFIYKGVKYSDLQDCCEQLKVSIEKLGSNPYESITLQLSYKAKAAFVYRGVRYSCVRACCKHLDIPQKVVKRLNRKTGLDFGTIIANYCKK